MQGGLAGGELGQTGQAAKREEVLLNVASLVIDDKKLDVAMIYVLLIKQWPCVLHISDPRPLGYG